MKPCEWCENEFSPAVSYQIYCSPECRTEATKIKSAEKQVINKRRKRYGKDRKCARGCGTVLSAYNDSNYCENCSVDNKKVIKALKELKGLIDYEDRR